MIKNGKLFGKINLFDLLVILLIVVLLFGIGYKFLVLDKEEAANTVEVTYELKIETVRDVTVNAFREDDTVYHYKLEEPIGKVYAVTTFPAMDTLDTLTGETLSVPVEDRYDLVVTVKGTAVRQDDGNLMMGKVKLVEGTELRVATQLAHCTAVVEDVQWN